MSKSNSEKRRLSLLTIVLFGVPMGMFFAIKSAIQTGDIVLGIIVGVITGPLSGVLFALLIGVFAKTQTKKFHVMRSEIAKIHKIVHDGEANHVINKEGAGGWLFLLPHELYFKSHKFNFQNHELRIPLETIESVHTYKNLGIIENGLLVVRKDGTQNKFVVYNPRTWVEKITVARKQ